MTNDLTVSRRYEVFYLFYYTSRTRSTKNKIQQLYKNKHTKLQIKKFTTYMPTSGKITLITCFLCVSPSLIYIIILLSRQYILLSVMGQL